MWLLLTGILIIVSIFALALVFVAFAMPFLAWEQKKPPKATDFRSALNFAWNFFFRVIFPWLLMYGGVRYFLELGT